MKTEYKILELTCENFKGEVTTTYEIGRPNENLPGTFSVYGKYDTLEDALSHYKTITKKILEL